MSKGRNVRGRESPSAHLLLLPGQREPERPPGPILHTGCREGTPVPRAPSLCGFEYEHAGKAVTGLKHNSHQLFSETGHTHTHQIWSSQTSEWALENHEWQLCLKELVTGLLETQFHQKSTPTVLQTEKAHWSVCSSLQSYNSLQQAPP